MAKHLWIIFSDHPEVFTKALPRRLHRRKLPTPHQIWCTASILKPLRGIGGKGSGPSSWPCSSASLYSEPSTLIRVFSGPPSSFSAPTSFWRNERKPWRHFSPLNSLLSALPLLALSLTLFPGLQNCESLLFGEPLSSKRVQHLCWSIRSLTNVSFLWENGTGHWRGDGRGRKVVLSLV